MKEHAGQEALADLPGEPREMSGVAGDRRRRCLDLECDDLTRSHLRDEIDLVIPPLLPEVVEPHMGVAQRGVGSQLGGDKGVQCPPQEIAVAEHRFGVDTEESDEERWVDEISLGRDCEAFEAVRSPCRKCIDDEEVTKEALVCGGSTSIHLRGFGDRRVGDHTGGVQRERFEEAS